MAFSIGNPLRVPSKLHYGNSSPHQEGSIRSDCDARPNVTRSQRSIVDSSASSRASSTNRRILANAIVISTLTIAVKAAGAAKVIVSGHLFGVGDHLDAYLIAFTIPSFLGDVFAGALNPVLIPAFIQSYERESESAALSLYANTLYLSLVTFSAAAVLLVLCASPILKILASGFSPPKLALAKDLLTYMAAILPLSALSVIWRSMLNAYYRFALAAAAPIATPLVTIAVVIGAASRAGISALALGTTLGSLVEVTVLALWIRRLRMPLFPRWKQDRGRVRDLFRQYRPVIVTNMVLGGSTMVDQVMATMLGSGSVSILNFGTRVPGVLLAIGPMALSTALFPRLSRISARRQWSDLRRLLRTYLLLSATLTIPVSIALAWFSEPLVRVVFERGAFTAADTHSVAAVQAFSLLQLPLAVMLALLVRTVASLRLNGLLIKTAGITIVMNAGFNYVLMRRIGVAGIALSTTIVQALSLALVAVIVFRCLDNTVLTHRHHAPDFKTDGD